MPKITDYPIAENAEDTNLLGVQGGELKQIPADKVGGGEVWEDITNEFIETFPTNELVQYIYESFADVKNYKFRITFECGIVSGSPSTYSVDVAFLKELIISPTQLTIPVLSSPVNALAFITDDPLAGTYYSMKHGFIVFSYSETSPDMFYVTISYFYETSIPENKAKIVKIEVI